MAVSGTGQSPLNAYTPGVGVASGVRQAFALIGGAVDNAQTLQREARAIPRREPAPFEDKVDVQPEPPQAQAAATPQAPADAQAQAPTQAQAPAPTPAPAPAPQPREQRDLSLTGLPSAEQQAPPPGRGTYVDVDA